jgi:CRP-like cAMP-binding protein
LVTSNHQRSFSNGKTSFVDTSLALNLLLAKNPIFSGLNPGELDQLSRGAISRRYLKGQWVTHHGDIWPYFFIIEEGNISAVKESSEGRSLIALSFKNGDVFWGLAFFDEHTPMPVALLSSETSQVHLWSRERLLPVIQNNGNMSWELCRLMVRRMLRASEIVDELAFQPVGVRLANLLLTHFGDNVGDPITRQWTLDEMAARIGTTREMVCRMLYRFAEEGAIQINRTEFMITDRGKLESHANPGKL